MGKVVDVSEAGFQLDMSMMFAVHDALRRDLVQVARIAAGTGDSPGKLLHAAMGWQIFKKFLVVHHMSEDLAVWPTLRGHVTGHPDQVALVDAMEAEHAAIDPLLAAIDEAAAGAGDDAGSLGDLVDALVITLNQHLKHEETDGLVLIDSCVTAQEWTNFSDLHRARIGDDRTLYMPWLLDGASQQTLTTILGGFPEQLLTMYREQWGPHYASLDLWGADSGLGRQTPTGPDRTQE
jgi:Hemerythrin HHE cation binding domain